MSTEATADPVSLWRRGEIDAALAACRALERERPRDARLPGLRAAILAASARADEAVVAIEAALALDPSDPMLRYQRGSLALARGRPTEAIADLQHALARNPAFAAAHNDLGQAHLRAGRAAEAVAILRDARARHPADATIAFSLAQAERTAGAPAAARAAVEASLRLRPAAADSWLLLLGLVAEHGTPAERTRAARAAAAALPDHAATLDAAGRTLALAGKLDEGRQLLERAVALAPDYLPALVNLGITYMRRGERSRARACLERAAQLAPQHTGVRFNLANLAHRGGRTAEALAHLAAALETAPGFALAHHYRASWLLESKGSLEQALEHAARACALEPENIQFLGTRLAAETAAWNPGAVAGLWQALRAHWNGGQALPAGLLFAASTDPRELREGAAARARTILEDLGARAPVPATRARPRPTAPLRVGYLSPDLGDHPVGLSLVEVLERHDRGRVEPLGLSLLRREDSPVRARLVAGCAAFHELGTLESPDLARFLGELDLDVLVDLAGYTSGAREDVLARRPAPLQVSYLGFPGTQAAPWIDYLIGDDIVLPPGCEPDYHEALVRLPGCFFPSDGRFAPPPAAESREREGLPPGATVLCCFNLSARISGELATAWLEILRRVPRAVLWLGATHPLAEARLRAHFADGGIEADRVHFAARTLRREDHLARHALADLYLDTYPYNGHSTTRDALLMGVPVLTCAGATFPSRVAASLLRTVRADELVTANLGEYVERAIGYAADPARLRRLRATLAERAPAALCDAAGLARALEAAYAEMTRRRQAGLAPASIRISEGVRDA
ncbi:MAG: tetratricopeptide repeat protein [Proteobacteria bacterium]|nr:tetratricopeptide repeat protein [Pseudomonadota bacterium]